MADPLASDGDTALAPGQAQATQKPPADPDVIPEDIASKMLKRGEDVNTRMEQYSRDEAAAAKKLPPVPSVEGGQLGKVGPAPQHDIRENAAAWLGFATALGGIAGAMTKRSSMNALAAFSGTLDGLMAGDQKKFDDNFKTWEAEAKRTQENNKAELDGYRNIMDRADLDHKQRADQLLIWATQNKNQFFIDLAKSAKEKGDFNLFTAALDSINAYGEKGADAAAKVIEERERRKTVNSQKEEDRKIFAEGIMKGEIDPTSAPAADRVAIGAIIQRQGGNWAKLQMDWQIARRFALTQAAAGNSPRMIQFVADSNNALGEIERLREVGNTLAQSSPPAVNAIKLAATLQANGDTEGAKIAQRYLVDINNVKGNLAKIENGGYAPTESSWGLAKEQLDENLPVGRLNVALDELKRLLQIRITSITQQLGREGLAQNLYMQGRPIPGTTATAPASTTTTTTAPAPTSDIPAKAIEKLRANPGTAKQFDDWYGPGEAAKILGGQ